MIVTLPREESGFIVTLNKTGHMLAKPDRYNLAFIDYVKTCHNKVLDIGVAYGVATIPVLQSSKVKVFANDIDVRHLEILFKRTPIEFQDRLVTVLGEFPHQLDFEPETFEAILASRVIHFLRGDDILTAFEKLYSWLKPGGKLFLTALTPYTGNFKAFIPIFEERVKSRQKWPGYVEDTSLYLAHRVHQMPPFLTVFDLEQVEELALKVGFKIDKLSYIPAIEAPDDLKLDGREHLGIICTKE